MVLLLGGKVAWSQDGDEALVRVQLMFTLNKDLANSRALPRIKRLVLSLAPDLTTEYAMQLIPGIETVLGAETFARYPGYLRTAGLP